MDSYPIPVTKYYILIVILGTEWWVWLGLVLGTCAYGTLMWLVVKEPVHDLKPVEDVKNQEEDKDGDQVVIN